MRVFAIAAVAALTGCTSISSNWEGEITKKRTTKIYVCSGFDCSYKTGYTITDADRARFAELLEGGSGSAAEERAALREAVSYFETQYSTAFGLWDTAKSTIGQSRVKGQMDCIDESTNTRSLLLFLEENGLLNHHKVEWNVSRGLFVDGRYPHSTAVVKDRGGKKWAIDSWYEPAGGKPDVMPLGEWMKRGVLGER